jgi:hypothetical protein
MQRCGQHSWAAKDIFALVLLRSAANQDDDYVFMLPEAGPISGAKLDPVFINAGADTSVFEELSCVIRTRAVVTSAAGGASRLSNHSSKGLRPLRPRYSLIVIMTNANV